MVVGELHAVGIRMAPPFSLSATRVSDFENFCYGV
jgi:hypothetical protein